MLSGFERSLIWCFTCWIKNNFFVETVFPLASGNIIMVL